ncbi:hypothetical protein WJX73_009745 [Symbiochloris irregularis]|uniref:RRM domain-containing protein n=1 Tax=Symbiochloris irregularis TaxID=706552 RepID=A0AAW1P357_9CHLO
MAEFDEYAYLEKQMDRKGHANGTRSDDRHRSRDDKDRHKSRDRDRERGRDRDRDDKHRSKPSRQSRERRPHRSRSREKPSRRERTPPEVVDVKIIMDRNTRRSKGFSYIEYANREDIISALSLTGQLLLGQPVMVKSSEAEKNLAWEAAQQQSATLAQMNALAAGGAGAGPCKLFVGNLHSNIAEADLKQIFEPFGTVELITLQRDATGRSQGIAYVQYGNMSDATKAMQQIDGLEIGNQKVSVKIVALTPAETAAAAVAAHVDLDDAEDDYGGMKLTSNARAALMSRLAGQSAPGGANGASTSYPGAPPVQLSPPAQALTMEQGILGPASPIATPCILLKNMFDPAEETEQDWDQDIAEEAKEECSKYGGVLHVHVDRNSKGFVYLRLSRPCPRIVQYGVGLQILNAEVNLCNLSAQPCSMADTSGVTKLNGTLAGANLGQNCQCQAALWQRPFPRTCTHTL